MTTEPLGSWNLFVFLVESTNIWVMRKSRLLSILVLAMLGCGNIENAMARKLLFESALVPATSPSPAAPYSNDGTHEGSSLRRVVIISIVVAIPVFVVSIMVSSICCWYNKKSPEKNVNQKKDPATPDKYIVIPIVPFLNNINSRFSKKKGWASQIEYSVLQAATDNFSCDNILGEGGFGCVYKAKFDENSVAAVKKLDASSKKAELEFQNEVELMSRIRHTNLVSLLGFCSCGNANFLVYELMQNGSLEDQLHGPSHGSALTWHLRMKIALDAARGLEHLHEQCNPSVIHRDFKSSNILLDSSFNAKLSDFGLAVKSSGVNGNADVELLGTLGYVAPEYMLDGKLTEKSDVYAYGVVLLELLFGRKPVDKTLLSECQSLVSWAMPQLTDRAKLPNIIDPVIKDTMNMKHLYQVAAIAVLCIQPEPSYRPLIADVVHSLVPLVPVDLGGALRVSNAASSTT